MTIQRLFLSVTLLLMSTVPAAEETVVVPVYEEPYHRLVFDKDNVRIFSTNITVGDTSLFHRHQNPTLYVILCYSLMRNQNIGEDWSSPDPDQSRPSGAFFFRNYADEPQEHRVDNIGSSPFQVIGVINFTEGGRGSSAPADEAELSNRWFNAYRYRLEPGKSGVGHRHDNPVIVVQVSEGRSHVLVDGRRGSAKTVKGNWSWHEAGVGHRLLNSGDTDVELVEIEIKLQRGEEK